jgi:VanZ family protein
MSSQPSVPDPLYWIHNQDKIYHFLEYGFLGMLLTHALSPIREKKGIITVIIICSLYAITDEVHQGFVPNRDASIADWIADTIGAAFASRVYLQLYDYWMRKWQKQN